MKKSIKIVSLLILFVVFVSGVYFWVSNSSSLAEYRWRAHALDTETSLAGAFATALSINHPVVYDWTDPSLKHRLDEWMNTHQSKKCTHEPDVFLVGPDENGDYDVSFGCYGANGWIDFKIDNIVIKDMKVVDWGAVRE